MLLPESRLVCAWIAPTLSLRGVFFGNVGNLVPKTVIARSPLGRRGNPVCLGQQHFIKTHLVD